MTTLVLSALLLGVAGSMHCIGMCGPLVSAIPVRAGSRWSRFLDRVLYHASRTAVYASMGAVVGLGASAFDLAGYGRIVSIVAGIGMVITAAVQLLWHKQVIPSSIVNRVTSPVRRFALDASVNNRRWGMLLLGAVNGLLPCGLVTSALIGSAAGGDIVSGVAFMAAFGLGTSPALVIVSFGFAELRQRFGTRVTLVLPVLTLVVGGLVLLRGMELGIPYVSPANVSHHAHVSCCGGR